MRKLITAVAALSAAFYSTTAFADWKPAGDKIKTAWAEKVRKTPCPNIRAR